MAAAPKASKRSAAQVAAGKKFAAGGRAAQAAGRAKGKKPSAAQHQAALKWAAAGRAAQAARRSGKKAPAKAVKRAAVAPELAMSVPGYWLGQCNTEYPACPAVAVANHLRAATGLAMSEREILGLYRIAGGNDGGAVIGHVLEVLDATGVFYVAANDRVAVRLAGFCPVDPDIIVAGYVVGLALPHAGHAVLAHPAGMVSWGQVLPWDGIPEEAWALEWERVRE